MVEGEPPAVPFDRDFWDGRWSEVLREHADQVAQRPPNADLTAVAGGLAFFFGYKAYRHLRKSRR